MTDLARVMLVDRLVADFAKLETRTHMNNLMDYRKIVPATFVARFRTQQGDTYDRARAAHDYLFLLYSRVFFAHSLIRDDGAGRVLVARLKSFFFQLIYPLFEQPVPFNSLVFRAHELFSHVHQSMHTAPAHPPPDAAVMVDILLADLTSSEMQTASVELQQDAASQSAMQLYHQPGEGIFRLKKTIATWLYFFYRVVLAHELIGDAGVLRVLSVCHPRVVAIMRDSLATINGLPGVSVGEIGWVSAMLNSFRPQ